MHIKLKVRYVILTLAGVAVACLAMCGGLIFYAKSTQSSAETAAEEFLADLRGSDSSFYEERFSPEFKAVTDINAYQQLRALYTQYYWPQKQRELSDSFVGLSMSPLATVRYHIECETTSADIGIMLRKDRGKWMVVSFVIEPASGG